MSRFTGTSNHLPPPVESFHFHRSDLGSINIMISAGGEVMGILDWESAGFYPRFWIATKPHISPAFDFCPELPEVHVHEWRKGLRREAGIERLSCAGALIHRVEEHDVCAEVAQHYALWNYKIHQISLSGFHPIYQNE